MIFTDLDGVETLVLHAPDSGVCRPELFNVVAKDGGIALTQRDGTIVDGSGENTVEPLFYVASKTDTVLVNAYEAELYTSNSGNNEIYFAADTYGSYARNWEISGHINKEWTEGLLLSFGVRDIYGNVQWFSIKEHAAGLDKEASTTIYDGVHAWWNEPSCNFYWNNALEMSYKIVILDDVLYAYYGVDVNNLQHAWTFPLTDSQFGGFAVDSKYQVGIYSTPGNMTFTDVSVSAENKEPKYYVSSATQGLSFGKVAGTITNDGTQNTTELFFAADENGSYATKWEYTGTVNRDNVESMILSFGVKDATGKTQWFSIKEHAAGLDNEGNNTIYNDTNAVWNYPACAFYWRYDDAMTINYKITVENDVLCAYFWKPGEGQQQAWYFPLTDSQFGGFTAGTAYQLGMFSRVACGLRFSNINMTVSGIAKETYQTDVLKGKYVSLLGDSITTYEGVSNNPVNNTTIATYHSWYNGAWQNVLNSYEETYWGQVITKYEMNLLVNNSHGGNRLIDTSGSGITVPAGYVRVENLAANTGELNGTKPDMIFIHMGTNDYIANITLGELTEDTYSSVVSGSGYKAPATFTEAYIITIEKASKLYPDAQIFVFTLIPSGYNTNWNLLNAYNARIRELAAHYDNVVLVDVAAESGINTSNYESYTHDGTHPNNAGIAKIAAVLEKAILDTL